MEPAFLLSLFFMSVSLIQAQPQIMPNQGPGIPPGSRPPNQGPGIPPGALLPNQGPGISSGARPPNQGPGMPPGARPPNQGPGISSGARPPNQGPGIPPGSRSPNQGPGLQSGVRTPNQGSGLRPGLRPIGQGPGMPPGVLNPNTLPMIPAGGRNPNQVPMSGGIQGGNSITRQCISAGNSATRECFQTYGVTRLQNVDALISGGSMTPGSRSEAQIRSAICRNQGNIIGCIYNKIDSLRMSGSCAGTPEYAQLQQETVSKVSGIQEICGKGPLASPDSCVSQLNSNVRQCYQKLGLNPNLFSINGTTVLQASGPGSLIKKVIGTDSKKAAKFCRLKAQLFSCMQQTLSRCPAGQTLMEQNGYDHSTLTSGIDVLCHNVNEYISSLRCLRNTSAESQRCQNSLVVKIRELEDFSRRQTMPVYQYQTAQCQLKIEHMECDIAAWKKTCPESVVGLKNEFECNILPAECKNNRNLQRNLTETCAIQRFQRHLRSGSSGRFSFSTVKMFAISAVTVLFSML